MSKINGIRTGCRDVFHSYLVHDARYDGTLEIPVIEPESALPNRLISFSKALKSDDYDQWVHFYEDDGGFERVWNKPGVYLPKLKQFNGVITPDFSLYRDMPLVMQAWNSYRGKALGHWWQSNGMTVLPNVRTGDERTYDFCYNGIIPGSTICVGSHGCMKIREERKYFSKGLKATVSRLHPACIVVYGSAPDDIFSEYINMGIRILQFDSEYSLSRDKTGA
ncbi:MAG: DUF4417 domain-containing protein [Lachnospiraceae bacterium]|nr:DUF4417 domain-containing protein [Lachnospiraceae bacterium]